MNPKHGLGRGLGALLGSNAATTSTEAAPSPAQELPIASIVANPQQPRKSFDPNSLRDLSDSLKRTGVLQPVVVRRYGQQYQIVVGERRWRAAQMAGLTHIPAIVREATEAQSLELALVENLLREDLLAELELVIGRGERKQGTGVAHGQTSCPEIGLDQLG